MIPADAPSQAHLRIRSGHPVVRVINHFLPPLGTGLLGFAIGAAQSGTWGPEFAFIPLAAALRALIPLLAKWILLKSPGALVGPDGGATNGQSVGSTNHRLSPRRIALTAFGLVTDGVAFPIGSFLLASRLGQIPWWAIPSCLLLLMAHRGCLYLAGPSGMDARYTMIEDLMLVSRVRTLIYAGATYASIFIALSFWAFSEGWLSSESRLLGSGVPGVVLLLGALSFADPDMARGIHRSLGILSIVSFLFLFLNTLLITFR